MSRQMSGQMSILAVEKFCKKMEQLSMKRRKGRGGGVAVANSHEPNDFKLLGHCLFDN